MNGTIAYVGNHTVYAEVDPRGHTTETHYARALAEHGYDVVKIQENATTPDDIERKAADCDLALYTRTHSWGLPQGVTEVWRRLEANGTLTASVHLDLFWGLARPPDRHDPLFTTGTVFTPDGDHDDLWEEARINHRYLRAGVVRDECYRATPTRHGNVDIIFVGSDYGYHAEWPHRQKLLGHMRDTYGDRFCQFGGREYPTMRGKKLNQLYANVPLVVGDTLSLAREHATFWSDRIYETWGRGGFLIHPLIDALHEEIGQYPWYLFDNWTDLDNEIDHWLDARNQDTKEEIHAETHEFVASHCTYTHRAAQLLDMLGLPYDKEYLP